MRRLLRFEKKFHIKHEFYHGGAFNGNTCHVIWKATEEMLDCFQPIEAMTVGGDGQRRHQWVGDGEWLTKEVKRWNKYRSILELYETNHPLCKHEVNI